MLVDGLARPHDLDQTACILASFSSFIRLLSHLDTRSTYNHLSIFLKTMRGIMVPNMGEMLEYMTYLFRSEVATQLDKIRSDSIIRILVDVPSDRRLYINECADAGRLYWENRFDPCRSHLQALSDVTEAQYHTLDGLRINERPNYGQTDTSVGAGFIEESVNRALKVNSDSPMEPPR